MDLNIQLTKTATDIILPEKTISVRRSLVIIGANGSGKTRLGSFIEKENAKSHRISAQKSLVFPDAVSPTDFDVAEAHLHIGHSTNDVNYRNGHRWNSKPETHPLNDYQQLLVTLYSEQTKLEHEACEKASTENLIAPPVTRLRQIKKIWENVLPERTLEITSNSVKVKRHSEPDSYPASSMSDGERVIFYLIGQALCTPKDGILIADEPELHLHKAVTVNLWNQIENSRPDCVFVYITHDIDFATSRQEASKICLREFKKDKELSSWDWFPVPESDDIPEEVFLKILGSRKPILFVEGNEQSIDIALYQSLYPNHHIINAGGCGEVTRSVKSFSKFASLHNLRCSGLIDRDFRTDSEVDKLKANNIYVLEVSEIENLFVIQGVLEFIFQHLKRTDFAEVFQKIQEKILDKLATDKETIVSRLTVNQIKTKLSQLPKKADNQAEIESKFKLFIESVKPNEIYQANQQKVEVILSQKDYEGTLKVYANKGLVFLAVQYIAELKGEGIKEITKRYMKEDSGKSIITAMRKFAPAIDEQPEKIEEPLKEASTTE